MGGKLKTFWRGRLDVGLVEGKDLLEYLVDLILLTLRLLALGLLLDGLRGDHNLLLGDLLSGLLHLEHDMFVQLGGGFALVANHLGFADWLLALRGFLDHELTGIHTRHILRNDAVSRAQLARARLLRQRV